MPIEASVMPSWQADRSSLMSSISSSAAAEPRGPPRPCPRASSGLARTSANSAATKKPLRSTSRTSEQQRGHVGDVPLLRDRSSSFIDWRRTVAGAAWLSARPATRRGATLGRPLGLARGRGTGTTTRSPTISDGTLHASRRRAGRPRSAARRTSRSAQRSDTAGGGSRAARGRQVVQWLEQDGVDLLGTFAAAASKPGHDGRGARRRRNRQGQHGGARGLFPRLRARSAPSPRWR